MYLYLFKKKKDMSEAIYIVAVDFQIISFSFCLSEYVGFALVIPKHLSDWVQVTISNSGFCFKLGLL